MIDPPRHGEGDQDAKRLGGGAPAKSESSAASSSPTGIEIASAADSSVAPPLPHRPDGRWSPSPSGGGSFLVVTADDFGADEAVNEAVETAHRDGVLTAASLMVAGSAAADAVARAQRLPRLGVGLHLVLVEGRPALPPEQVPDLVDDSGHFRTNMALAGLKVAISPAARRQLAAEIEAQFAAFAATGLPLDHVNAHKHFHVHPVIGGLVIDAARRHGARAIRAPIEPGRPHGSARLAIAFARRLRARAARAGLIAPTRVFGLADSGRMDTDRTLAALAGVSNGLNELYLHPAVRDDWAGHAPGYRYRAEFDALVAPAVREAVTASGARLGCFADFA